jgi:hypothetical protein
LGHRPSQATSTLASSVAEWLSLFNRNKTLARRRGNPEREVARAAVPQGVTSGFACSNWRAASLRWCVGVEVELALRDARSLKRTASWPRRPPWPTRSGRGIPQRLVGYPWHAAAAPGALLSHRRR